jgi:hypothetical protein
MRLKAKALGYLEAKSGSSTAEASRKNNAAIRRFVEG